MQMSSILFSNLKIKKKIYNYKISIFIKHNLFKCYTSIGNCRIKNKYYGYDKKASTNGATIYSTANTIAML